MTLREAVGIKDGGELGRKDPPGLSIGTSEVDVISETELILPKLLSSYVGCNKAGRPPTRIYQPFGAVEMAWILSVRTI